MERKSRVGARPTSRGTRKTSLKACIHPGRSRTHHQAGVLHRTGGQGLKQFPSGRGLDAQIASNVRSNPLAIRNRSESNHCHSSPLPNISTLAILISPRKSPQIAKHGVPKINFPELPGPRVSVEFYNFPEFPGPSRFRILGSPFSAFWGEMKLICWAVLSHSRKGSYFI